MRPRDQKTSFPGAHYETPEHRAAASSPASPQTGTLSHSRRRSPPAARQNRSAAACPAASQSESLHANPCPRWRLQAPPQVPHLPLHRPHGPPDPLLPLELLSNHIGVAGMPAETLGHPLLQPTQPPWPTPSAIGYPAALGQIPADRHV